MNPQKAIKLNLLNDSFFLKIDDHGEDREKKYRPGRPGGPGQAG